MNAPEPIRALLQAQPAGRVLDGAQLHAVFASMAVGMLVFDGAGSVIDTNPAAEALLGLPRCEILRRSAHDPGWQALDAEGQPLSRERNPVLQTLNTGQPAQNVEMGIALIGGGRRWLLVNTVPLAATGGAPAVVASFVDISKRRRLEQHIAQQGQRLRAVLEGTRTATWQWNVQTGEVELDARWSEQLGLPAEDLQLATIATWTARIHSADRAGRLRGLQQHFDGAAETFEAEYRMQHSDGSWRWVRDRGRVTARNEAGAALWMLGTHDDIHTLKEAELAKSRYDELMHALFELSPLGLQLIDVAQRAPVAVNAALSRITGYAPEELLHVDSRGRYAESAQPIRDQWFLDAHRLGHFGPSEVQYIHKSGRLINLVFHGVRVTDARHKDYLWLSVADITEQHALEQALRDSARQDRLTGLLNRSAFSEVLEQRVALQRDAPLKSPADRGGLAVFFLDFDRFKVVNDALGHRAGDELLRGIAQRLRQAAGQQAGAAAGSDRGWTVARFGGDEFVILLPGVADGPAACLQAQALLLKLSAPYRIGNQDLHASASIGVSLWSPALSAAEDLLRHADIAMYEAKRAGRSRCVLFDDSMRARLTRAAVIESELRHAVERGQLQAVYQPIVDLDTGAMTSVEALLRWHHPELGSVSPSEFIPVAEASGHIVMLGEWILRESCLQWTAWQRENPALAPATISVNLSREQVSLGRRVITLVSEALTAARMPPSALQLEITEREVMKHPEQARELLLELSAMGVRLAMDDFGTGSSSLGCLRDFPFHTIKIDKSFVTNVCRDPHVLAVAHATVNVIENLGMVSVAEGIEDPSEVAVLQAMGCRYGQGYLFARPLPAAALLGVMGGAVRA